MGRPDRYFDWQQLEAHDGALVDVVDARRRLRLLPIIFVLTLATVYARLIWLEVREGSQFRELAARPVERRQQLPGLRGRILTREGTVLAYDRVTSALAVEYRWLQEPANPDWLRRQARTRLARRDRRDRARLLAETQLVAAQRTELHRRLAELCGLSFHEWQARARRIQNEVETIRQRVNERRQRQYRLAEAQAATRLAKAKDEPLWQRWARRAAVVLLPQERTPPLEPVTVSEELAHHVVAAQLPLEVVAEIEAHPGWYPGVRVIEQPRRTYSRASLAAHLVGHLGAVTQDELESAVSTEGPVAIAFGRHDRVGRMGVERRYEPWLRGAPGELVEFVDRSGRVVSVYRSVEPTDGHDLVLTLDAALQKTAETLLDEALQRRLPSSADGPAAEPGGAILVMEAASGAVLAAASAPRFDPNLFAGEASAGVAELLRSPGHPLLDRVSMMAIPPGSVFKIVSAIALVEAGALDPEEPFFCQGYLEHPDRKRCAVYRHTGAGHGETRLVDAMVRSCNVYFFHHAAEAGAVPLVDWALRFGFGQRTGIDLPDEAAGFLPTPGNIREAESHGWRTGDTQALAVGQGSLRATPLQIARLLAAVANGGELVTPYVASGLAPSNSSANREGLQVANADGEILQSPPRKVLGLDRATLEQIRTGLGAVVSSSEGTAHDTVYLDSVSVAGKTGTAETGEDREDHAWFAGYAPAEAPRVVFVVALEHAGRGSEMAGPVARRLVERMRQLGYFDRAKASRASE